MKSRTKLEKALENAAAALVRERDELTQARKTFMEAEAAYLDRGDKASQERQRDARDAMERAEKRERAAAVAYDAATEDFAALAREDQQAEFDAISRRLKALPDVIARRALEFIALDRRLDDLVLDVAGDVVAAASAHDKATNLASELRIGAVDRHLGPVPSLTEAAFIVRRVVSEARLGEGRDDLAALWMATSPDATDWRKRDLTAQEMVSVEHVAAVARKQEHDQAVANAGAIQAGLVAVAGLAKTKPEVDGAAE